MRALAGCTCAVCCDVAATACPFLVCSCLQTVPPPPFPPCQVPAALHVSWLYSSMLPCWASRSITWLHHQTMRDNLARQAPAIERFKKQAEILVHFCRWRFCWRQLDGCCTAADTSTQRGANRLSAANLSCCPRSSKQPVKAAVCSRLCPGQDCEQLDVAELCWQPQGR